MIYVSTINLKRTIEQGHFSCPQCGHVADYRKRSSRVFLTIYFIPVVPIDRRVEYVECRDCKTSFTPAVLEGDSESDPSEFEETMLLGLASFMNQGADVTDRQIQAATSVLHNLLGLEFERETLGYYCGVAHQMELAVLPFFQERIEQLNMRQRTHIAQCLFFVASAEGELRPVHLETLLHIRLLFGFTESEFQELVDATGDWNG